MKTLLGALLALAMLAGCAGMAQKPIMTPPVATQVSSAELVVQQQVEAYNRRDLDAFLNAYANDAEAFAFPDKLLGAGQAAFRSIYQPLFRDTPDLAVTISRRIVQGDTVIDEEWVVANGRRFKAVAIYHVVAGKIRRVWFIE